MEESYEESYKEKRSKFARQIGTIRKEREKQINQVEHLLISDELKKECKSQIMDNFHNKAKEISKLPGYQESRESHLPDIQERINIIKRKNLKMNLFGNSSAVLKDMKRNYVDIEKDKEMLGRKGRVVHINFPAVGDFKGFKTDFFVSKDSITANEFELDPKYEKFSRSFQDSKEILEAIAGYMREYGINHIYGYQGENSKGSYDYGVDDYFEFKSYYSFLLHYFEELIGLSLNVRVSDTCVYHDKRCRYKRNFCWRDGDFIIHDCDDSETKGELYMNWTNE